MQPSTVAFFDELEKIAIDPLRASLIAQGVTGAMDIGLHGPWSEGGISPVERQMQQQLLGAKAMQRAAKDKEKAEKQIVKAMKARAQAAESAEMAGAPLGMGAVQAGGFLGARQLGKSIHKGERGLLTTSKDIARLQQAIAPKAAVELVPGGIEQAVHIPKGGILPRPLRPIEEWQYKVRGIDPSLVQKGFEGGVSLAPIRSGAHVGAHELGHAAVGATRLGRVGRFLRFPLGIGGGIGGMIAASKADPESATAKYVAPALAAASVAPVLGEEAAASIKAVRGMRRAGFGQPAISAAKRQLAKAFGTYGLAFGAPVVASPFIIRAVRKYRQKSREEKGLPSYKELQQQYKERKKKKK
jgi:hypothetical protein